MQSQQVVGTPVQQVQPQQVAQVRTQVPVAQSQAVQVPQTQVQAAPVQQVQPQQASASVQNPQVINNPMAMKVPVAQVPQANNQITGGTAA